MPRAGLVKSGLIAVLPAIVIALIVAGCSGESPVGNGGSRAAGSLSVTEAEDSAGDVAATAAGGRGGGRRLRLGVERIHRPAGAGRWWLCRSAETDADGNGDDPRAGGRVRRRDGAAPRHRQADQVGEERSLGGYRGVH